MHSEKVLKNSIKLLRSPFPVMLLTFFTPRALQGQLDAQMSLKMHLNTRRTLGVYLGTQGNWVVEHLRYSEDTWTLGQTRYLSTWVLEHLGTQRALGQSTT